MSQTRRNKANGRACQNWVRDKLRDIYSDDLEPDDLTSAVMGSTGEDIVMSPLAQRTIGLTIECKHKKTGFTPCYDALDQADRKNGRDPIAVIHSPRRKHLVVMDAETFFRHYRRVGDE